MFEMTDHGILKPPTDNNIFLFIWGLTSLSTLYRSYQDG